MRSDFAHRGGFTLIKSPTYRQQAGRRLALAVCGFLALALMSGLIGSLVAPAAPPSPAQSATGPFSYFPSE